MCVGLTELICDKCRDKQDDDFEPIRDLRDTKLHEKVYARWLRDLCEGCHQVACLEGYLEAWGSCFDCGVDLFPDMVEDEDWFEIRQVGEAFPVCKTCHDGGDVRCQTCTIGRPCDEDGVCRA